MPHLPAISCLGAFQTPASERVAGLVIAGVRKPAQNRPSAMPQRDDCLGSTAAGRVWAAYVRYRRNLAVDAGIHEGPLSAPIGGV